MFLLLLALGCGTPKEAPVESATPTDESADAPSTRESDTRTAQTPQGLAPPPRDAEVEACFSECMQQSMARSVAAEVIERDCLAQCKPDDIVRTAKDLELSVGQAVTAVGEYLLIAIPQPGGDLWLGTGLQLDDKSYLWLTKGKGTPHGWEGLLGTQIGVAGTLAHREGRYWLDDPDAPLPRQDLPGQDELLNPPE